MRTVAMVTSARSDWGIQRPIAEALRQREDVRLSLIVCGMHLSREFGHTVDQIIADGFEVAHRLDFLVPDGTPKALATSMGRGVTAFSSLFARWRPDVLTVLGDRFDMFPAAVAATPFLIPIAHIHGGEVTQGAIDDALRHAMTKMSHIHLVATEEYARRVRQMGEDPRHVHVVGAPGLDDLLKLTPLDETAIRERFGFEPGQVNLLVTYYPETRSYQDVPRDVAELFAALESVQANFVIIRPNADTGHLEIQSAIDAFCRRHARARAPASLSRREFLSVMRAASAMVGNSSAGIIEAPSFGLPVVNVGRRQEGRLRAGNVIDCAPTAGSIGEALRRALSPDFRASLAGLENPYGDGRSGRRIAEILASVPLDRDLTLKRFVDVPRRGEGLCAAE